MSWFFLPLHGIFLLIALLSHICASLFLAKPRFGKAATVGIWLIYGILFLSLPAETPTLNFFISLGVNFLLFFVTTVGHTPERGFLFLSYTCIHTCFSTIINIMEFAVDSILLKIVLALCFLALMQILLYMVLLPAFRTVTPYIQSGWGKFYSVILAFFVLLVAQCIFPARSAMTSKEIVVFLVTVLTFCITCFSMFNNMKNMVELSREKQKQTNAELLFTQVKLQEKEAKLVRQNHHDMRHHYQTLLSYAESGDLNKLTDYLKHQTAYIETITTGRFCENETINNILKVFHRKADEQNITIEIRAAAKLSISATDPDLVSIIANILENALHGAAKSGSKEPFIHVNIKHQAQRFVVSCENSCIASLDFGEMPDYLRGIGIQSITATADKYNGSCLFSAKDGVFRCQVIMDE